MMKVTGFINVLGVVAFFAQAHVHAAEFHVTVDGSPKGSGSRSRPWSLSHALSHPRRVRPGDIVWVHGGVYSGNFVSKLRGSASRPIVVRNYEGERVIISNGNGRGILLWVQGAHCWYWGLELMNPIESTLADGTGISIDAPYTKVINCFVHDNAGSGITVYNNANGAEVYGNIILYNGRQEIVDGHAYGIYIHSGGEGQKLQRRVVDNIIPFTWSCGIHAYTSNYSLDSMYFEGNVIFNSGHLWRERYYEWNMTLGTGPGTIAYCDSIIANHFYYSEEVHPGSRNNFGWNGGTDRMVLKDNMISGGILNIYNARNAKVSGNWCYNTTPEGYVRSMYPNNIWLQGYPGRDTVFVRPNRFESGRATIIIYNWDETSSTEVDFSKVLRPGDTYVVRDPLNFHGDVITSGRYTGGTVCLPMRPTTVMTPVGNPKGQPFHTAPRFAVFVVMRTEPTR